MAFRECILWVQRTPEGETRLRYSAVLDDRSRTLLRVPLEEIEARGAGNCLLSVDALFPDMPEVRIEDARTERALRNGADVKFRADFEGECRVYAGSGEFLLLGAVKNGVLHTIKSFFEV